jgi:branched-chain amino acid transport system permease protein
MNARQRPAHRWLVAIWPNFGLVAPMAVGVALVSLGAPSLQTIGVGALVNLVMVVGLQTFWGNSGVLSFGHVAFVAVGAYCTALLTIPLSTRAFVLPHLPGVLAHRETSFVMATVVAAVVAAAVAGLLSLPLMRLSGTAAGIASFAMLIIVQDIASNWSSVTGGLGTLTGVPTDLTLWKAYAWSVIVIAGAGAYSASRSGKRLQASREDEVAALALGVKVTRERRVAFIVSGAMTGVAGSMYAHWLGAFGPDDFYVDLTRLITIMLIIGGLRSVSGAVVGSVVMSAVVVVLNRWESGQSVGFLSIPVPTGFSNLLLSLVLVLILLRRPDGITRSRELSWPIWKPRVPRVPRAANSGPDGFADRQDDPPPDRDRNAAEAGTGAGVRNPRVIAQEAATGES